jgi:hypothetical protein
MHAKKNPRLKTFFAVVKLSFEQQHLITTQLSDSPLDFENLVTVNVESHIPESEDAYYGLLEFSTWDEYVQNGETLTFTKLPNITCVGRFSFIKMIYNFQIS